MSFGDFNLWIFSSNANVDDTRKVKKPHCLSGINTCEQEVGKPCSRAGAANNARDVV